MAKKVHKAEPEGEAWVQFDFGSNFESRVVTGVSIKSSKHYRMDPVSVRVSYYDPRGEVWEELDPIDLDWDRSDGRYTEFKFELHKDGRAFAAETTSMRFDFTAKENRWGNARKEIAVQ